MSSFKSSRNKSIFTFEPRHEKTNNVVSDQVWHEPDCTATADG